MVVLGSLPVKEVLLIRLTRLGGTSRSIEFVVVVINEPVGFFEDFFEKILEKRDLSEID